MIFKICLLLVLIGVTISGLKVVIEDIDKTNELLLVNNSLLSESLITQSDNQKRLTEIEKNMAILRLEKGDLPTQAEPIEETGIVPEF